MATSRNTGHSVTESSFRSYVDGLPELSRYDVVLAAIPLVFALTLSAHALLSVSLRLAIAAGAVLSGLLLVDAVYLHPPVKSSSDRTPR
jgi:hypothetical protein